MKNRKQRTTWTMAEACRVLDDPESTPADVRRAADWGAIPGLSARIWLVGYLAGRCVNGAPPAPAKVTLFDEVLKA